MTATIKFSWISGLIAKSNNVSKTTSTILKLADFNMERSLVSLTFTVFLQFGHLLLFIQPYDRTF